MNVYEEDYTDPKNLQKRLDAGGPLQSIIFMMESLRQLEFYGLKWQRLGQYVIHDYGCACGFGTAVLACEFPHCKTVGLDLNPTFIDFAKETFPTLEWQIGDVRDPQEDADIIWTSHTVEHIKRPDLAILKLVEQSRLMTVVILPPIELGEVTHKGAMLTEDLMKALHATLADRLLLLARYSTTRVHRPTKSNFLEHSIMLVFRGSAL